MATTAAPPCYNCGGNLTDLTGTAQIKKIERLIADNYTIIGICIVLVIVLSLVAWYFGSQLLETIKSYKKSLIKARGSDKSATVEIDNEIYDEEATKPYDMTKYLEPGKQDFVKTMEDAYKDYNNLKTEYLRSNNKSENDDLITKDTIFYKKYDEYEYKKPEKNEDEI